MENHTPKSFEFKTINFENLNELELEPELDLFLNYLLNKNTIIWKIPDITFEYSSFSIKIPMQKWIRVHLKTVIKLNDFEVNSSLSNKCIQISEDLNMENVLIGIKTKLRNIEDKRMAFKYCRIVNGEKNDFELKNGLPFEFYCENNRINDLSGKDWILFTKSWFVLNQPPRKNNEKIHPGKYPEVLIEQFINFFTKKGQIVVDPFLGIGSTMVAAFNTYRSCIGIELSEKYWNISSSRMTALMKKEQNHSLDKFISPINKINNKNRYPFESEYECYQNSTESELIYKPILGDSSKLLEIWGKFNYPDVDFCITSPPYWNQLKRNNLKQIIRKNKGLDTQYSFTIEDIGNIDDYQEFLIAQKKIFTNIDKILKPNSYVAVITNNVFTNGRLYPLAYDTLSSLSDIWVPKDEKIWIQDSKPLMPLGVNKAWVGNRHHQYCLIFRKEEKNQR